MIVLIGSLAGKYGKVGCVDCAVTKIGECLSMLCRNLSNRRVVLLAMMYGMTMTLKNEVVKIAPKGRVNSVAPGLVRTPMAESALADPDVLYRALAT